jgi:hypothetical protein
MFAPAGCAVLVQPVLRTWPVPERLRVREIGDDEGRRLVRIVRRGSGSVVTWRRAQMVLLSAQGMDAAAIAGVAFTSEDRVRDVIRNSNADGCRRLGRRQQHRNRLHPGERILAQPDRGPVHRPALLRARRHRPPQPPRAGQHDPPLHHLAQQPRLRRTTPPGRRPRGRRLNQAERRGVHARGR